MYSRSYKDDATAPVIPENYDGNAFRRLEEEPPAPRPIIPTVGEAKYSPREDFPKIEEAESDKGENATESAFASFFGKAFGKSIIPKRVTELLHIESFKLGVEELIIIGVALFLLFSKEGDRECAISLLFLLFVN